MAGRACNTMKDKILSGRLEDYLEAIYQLAQEKNFAHANKIAEYLSVGKSSVTWALGKLSAKGLINHSPYEAVTLTEKGTAVAERIAHRHEGIRDFLTGVLAINSDVAEVNACRMEHVVDREVLERMQQFMGFLENCPRAGREWMQGFGHFCEQGAVRDNCRQCLSQCLDDLTPDSKVVYAGDGVGDRRRGDALQPVVKTSKARDKATLSRLTEVLAESGSPFNAAQAIVAEVFMATEQHQTLDNIYREARQRSCDIDMASVESTVAILCEHKIARSLRFEGQTVYEHFHPESHHDHLFCVKCGAIIEFFDPRIEALQAENARRADFRLLLHNLDIYGVCHDCMIAEARGRTLGSCLAGEVVRLVRLGVNRDGQGQLADMGLFAGAVVEVLSEHCQDGNMIVMAGEGRFMLDRETAGQIRVEPVAALVGGGGRGSGYGRRHHRHLADKGLRLGGRGGGRRGGQSDRVLGRDEKGDGNEGRAQ